MDIRNLQRARQKFQNFMEFILEFLQDIAKKAQSKTVLLLCAEMDYSTSWSYEVQWKANRQIIELTSFL